MLPLSSRLQSPVSQCLSGRCDGIYTAFRCLTNFTRSRDLLLRHQANHAKDKAQGPAKSERSSERAIKACDHCVLSKLKCDNGRPCLRCQRRNISCSSASLDQQSSPGGPTPDGLERDAILTPPETSDGWQPGSSVFGSSDNVGHVLLSDSPLPSTIANSMGPQSWPLSNGNVNDFDFPAFFDHIMVPREEYVSAQSVQMPPSISTLMPDKDWLSEADVFGLAFTPAIDLALESYAFPEVTANLGVTSSQEIPSVNDARTRYAIFQRSHWMYKPASKENAFSEHNQIPLDENNIDMASSPHQPFLPLLDLQAHLSAQMRDRIFQMALKAAKWQVSIPAFPSTNCLDTLLKVGIAKRVETDAWIHPYTLDFQKARPELIAALIAAGCVCFGISTVNKTGLVLVEVVRVALNRLLEDDNSVIRDLQYLQACMTWLDLSAFCGFKRKMEIAESNLQPLVTALRRAGKFDRASYTTIAPDQSDSEDRLREKWELWVMQESYKRLVHHLFAHDTYSTVAKVRNPLISYAELSLPLPASRNLWLAPNPSAWKTACLARQRQENGAMSLRDLLASRDLLQCLPSMVDQQLSKTAYLHGCAAQAWEYQQQAIILGSPCADMDPSAQLWMQSRHEKLYQTLLDLRTPLSDCWTVTTIFHEFVMMSLHVDAEHVTRFAGKYGEHEAHGAYQTLQPWSQSKQARIAIAHAGAVVRAARAVPPYQLRGSDAFNIYHAVMVLWAFGMMQKDAARRTGTSTPVVKSRSAPHWQLLHDGQFDSQKGVVFLDEAPQAAGIHAYIRANTGRPCLKLAAGMKADEIGQSDSICDLRNSQAVMKIGVQALESNYTNTVPDDTRSNLPQLIKTLCDLMDELGSLQ